MIRVALPYHLRNLARTEAEVEVDVAGAVTVESIVDALEKKYPMLAGTVRDHATRQRRPFLRFYVCGEDYSHLPPDTLLPEKIRDGSEPFLIVGAMSGG